ncbi:MAG: pirin family protein [Bacillaceae bacterium]
MSMEVYAANRRYTANHGWLKSNFSFSFAEYHDPTNIHFGVMRVLNDDIVQPSKGFGMHPHKEMEIVTIVLDGELEHKDSAGHTAKTGFGGIQRMSAGTGIYHSEYNPSREKEVNLLQMWFFPEVNGLTPSYEQTSYDISKMKNALLPVVTKNPTSDEVAHIHQDLTIYLSNLEEGREITFTQQEGRRIFLFVIEGSLVVNGETLNTRDSARIKDVANLQLTASQQTKFMLIDLP